MKTKLYGASAAVVLAYAAGWLITSDSSPLADYFLWHVAIPNWWMAANVAPAIIAAIAAGNPHSWNGAAFHAAFAAQWFAFGYAAASLASTLRSCIWKPR